MKVCYDQKKKGPEKIYRDQKLKKKKKNMPESTQSLVYYCLGFENVLVREFMLRI